MMSNDKRGMRCMVLVGAVALVMPSVAIAEKAPRVTVAAEVLVMPTGEISFSAAGEEASAALEPSIGAGAQLDYWITADLALVLAPRVLTVEPDDEGESATQVDLVGRVQGRFTLAPQTQGLWYVGLGYSALMLPEGDETPTGLLIDGGLGVRQALTARAFLQGLAGYAVGFQGGTINGNSYSFSTNGLHLGVGVGTAL